MSSGPERRFTVALYLALSLTSVACGSVGESTGAGLEETPSEPTPYAAMAQTSSCTPSIALGDPIAAPLPSFACPFGWEPRLRNSALPIAGRFSNAREMVDALCTQAEDKNTTSGGGSSEASFGVAIDFETNDVVAVAYDGEVGLHRRGTELWIRHTESCEPSYRTALFVVPKDAEPREQTCTAICD